MDMAHKIDPPEEDHPDEIQIVCSTECPYANGGIVRTALDQGRIN